MPPTNADYAKINIACKDLCLDKYQLIGDRYGLESSKQLTRHQLVDLYAHFLAKGWTPKASKNKLFGKKYPKGYQRKVQALWITLEKAGSIRKPGDDSMNSWVKKNSNRSNLRFCNYEDCSGLIEGLKAWAKREGVDVC